MSIVVKDADGTVQTVNTLPSPGQATMANSLPVVIASNQSSLPITLNSSTANIGVVTLSTSTVSLNTSTLSLNTNSITVALNTTTVALGGSITLNTGTATVGNINSLDYGPAWTSVRGVSGVPFTSADQHSTAISVTDAPTSGQKICVDDIIISVDTTMSVTFKEETSGTVIFGPWYCTANSGPIQVTLRSKIKLPTANKKLQVIASTSGNISVLVGYHSEA